LVRIRLQRVGRRHQPSYRIVVADPRVKQTGRVKEVLGTYQPEAKNDADRVKWNRERVQHWLDCGAQPSETVVSLLKAQGFLPARLRGRPGAR